MTGAWDETTEAVFEVVTSGMLLRALGHAPTTDGQPPGRPNEAVVVPMVAASLMEWVKPPTTVKGRSQGVSFRLGRGVSYRTNLGRGRVVPEADHLETVDEGRWFVTSTRVVFVGAAQTREWKLDNLLSVDPMGEGCVALHVSNRPRPSVLAVGGPVAMYVQAGLVLRRSGAQSAYLYLEQACAALGKPIEPLSDG